MNRPTKKEIRAAVEKLKTKVSGEQPIEQNEGKLTPKKSSQRIRKQGI